MFSGGQQSNDFLSNLGFEIRTKNHEGHVNTESNSWVVTSATIAIKELDKSSFLHNGTGIPKEIRFYFDILDMVKGQKRQIVIEYEGQRFSAVLELDKQPSPRSRMIWKADFSKVLKNKFPALYNTFAYDEENLPDDLPKIQFVKSPEHDNYYKLSFVRSISINTIEDDIEADVLENTPFEELRQEGAVRHYYGKRYERDSQNRKLALQIHGLSCVVCGFNFEKVYGKRGKDFIEVHHTKPLFSFEGQESDINPETDLVPVCANCHRMIHRRKDDVLSIEELKEIVTTRSDA
ncbi:restriction endonuclease [Cohnella fermenti]|uniref:Restriction endonuclease n=2 Tax=Cohnella fermenti TaxID=2565925 RepID=A0A4V3WE11_9BACL|nr:restriction endonuclease [Cohnella fermenti]